MQTPVSRLVVSARCGGLRRYGGSPASSSFLVCFPWAGGGASAFRRFAPHLPQGIELLAVQYPGREDRIREAPLSSMELIVRQVLDDVAQLPDRPLVFFGHSMGALVAYEVAQSLAARFGRQPQLLVVSGSGAPATRTRTIAANAGDQAFIDDIGRMGGTPHEILQDAPLMRALLPVLRADYRVLDDYVGRLATPLSCPLVACGGEDDPTVSPATLEAWRDYTTGPCRLHWFAGNHFYLQADPGEFAARLQEWIATESAALPAPHADGRTRPPASMARPPATDPKIST